LSDSTRVDLDEAIRAHFADEHDGALVTGYVLQIMGKGFTDPSDDEKTRMLRAVPDQQGIIVTLGLIDYMRTHLQSSALDTSQ
jgi:hypothetical protein